MSRRLASRSTRWLDRVYRWGARAVHVPPSTWPRRQGLEVHRDIPYGEGLAQRLDVYRPRTGEGPWPAVMFVHGGGFALLSKDTHWMFAQAFARRGMVVFSVDYRLAPEHPFPRGLEDVLTAYRWVLTHGARYGADGRVAVAGESAGANLALGVCIASTVPRPEPGAAAVLGQPPAACIAMCGLLQVTRIQRLSPRGRFSALVRARLAAISAAYLTGAELASDPSLADPLVLLEQGVIRPQMGFPPVWVAVGTADPVLDDSRRLGTAMRRAGLDVRAREYEGQPHAFMALWWRREARRAWDEIFEFLAARGLFAPKGTRA